MQTDPLIQARSRVADSAYAEFDFGLPITDANAWDDTHSEDWRKVCYADDNGDTARLVLHALFAPGSAELVEVYALDLVTGAMVGGLAASPLERAEAAGFASAAEAASSIGVWGYDGPWLHFEPYRGQLRLF